MDAVSKWSSETSHWLGETDVTLTRLSQGSFSTFENEAAMIDRCEKLTLELKLDAKKSSEHEMLDAARRLLADGNVVAAIEQYDRWQDDWLKNAPEAPPTYEIKEALLAPSALFALHYLQARRTVQCLSSDDANELIARTLAKPFHNGVQEALEGQRSLKQIEHVHKVLSAARDALKDAEKVNVDLAASEYAPLGLAAILSGAT